MANGAARAVVALRTNAVQIHDSDKQYIEKLDQQCRPEHMFLRLATFFVDGGTFLGTALYYAYYADVESRRCWYWVAATDPYTPILCHSRLSMLHKVPAATGQYIMYDCFLWKLVERGTFDHRQLQGV